MRPGDPWNWALFVGYGGLLIFVVWIVGSVSGWW
jgi:hypothetical protein